MKYGARAITICWRSALFWLLTILLAGFPTRFGGYLAEAATSQDSLHYQPPAPLPSPSIGGILFQLVLSLIVVIGLVLAEIFGKIYVLGVTDHNISTLLGENEIDLSQLKQVVADVERKRALPAYFNKPFLQILESKIQDLKRSYSGGGKDGQPR